MGTIVIRLLQMRLRLDAFDDPSIARSRIARLDAGTRPASSASKHASISVSDERRDQRHERLVPGERRLHTVATGHAEHGGADRESGGGALLPLASEEPIGVPADERLDGGIRRARALHDGTARRPAQTVTALHQMASARSRAARPGRRAAASASSTATRSSAPGPRSRTSSAPPTAISPADLGASGGDGLATGHRGASGRPSSTCSGSAPDPEEVVPSQTRANADGGTDDAPHLPRLGAEQPAHDRGRPAGGKCDQISRRRSRVQARR